MSVNAAAAHMAAIPCKKQRLKMHGFKRACANAERKTAIRSFHKAVNLVNRDSFERSTGDLCSGLVNILSDDDVAHVFDFMMGFDTSASGLEYLNQAKDARKTAIHFALTCKRVASILKATRQHAEIIARGSTSILPSEAKHPYPFTVQMKSEMSSCDQLKMLREAQKSMACHCAKACCRRYQRSFCRDLNKGRIFKRGLYICTKLASVAPALESCHMLSASPCGNHAFAHINRKLSKQGVHGEGRGRRFQNSLVKLEVDKESTGPASFKQKEQIDIDVEDMSAPLTMRASANGYGVVFVCSEHTTIVETEELPFSRAMLWISGLDQAVKIEPPVFPTQPAHLAPALSAQDAWFIDSGATATEIVVAWSTDFVHPSGHRVGSNGGANGAAYLFATYTIEGGVVELFEHTDIAESNQLMTCSPTATGDCVLLLVRRRDTYIPGFRSTYIHSIRDDTSVVIPHNIPNSTKGPMCASISPTGDCVVSMHRTGTSLEVDVMVRTSNVAWGFSPVQRIDVSPWLGLSPTASDFPTLQYGLVKAKFSLSFSPCGRFVVILDRHPFYGEEASNSGVLTIDTALRMHASRSLRPIPFFSTNDQQPRAFQWTKNGIWLLPPGTDDSGSMGPRGGALCVYAPSKE